MTDDCIDCPCGAHFTFRSLIEAGETWRRLRIPNIPLQNETWDALCRLAVDILDPVFEQFGPLTITYGFAPPTLTRRVPGRIDPSRDQHAGYERRPDGRPVCPRLGQAADFVVDDASSARVAAWVAERLPFDRLYFYGPNKPIHVSVGPQNSRRVVEMIEGPSGRRVPQRRTLPSFIARYSTG